MDSSVNFSSEVAVVRSKSMWMRKSIELPKGNSWLQPNTKCFSHAMKHVSSLSPNLPVLSRINPCISVFLSEKKRIPFLCLRSGEVTGEVVEAA